METNNHSLIAPPLSQHLIESLKSYVFVVSTIITVLFSFMVAIVSFGNLARSDRQLLQEIESVVSSLVESQDRPELLRLIKSIAERRKSQLVVVQEAKDFGNIVIASSRTLEEIDLPYRKPKTLNIGFGISFSIKSLVSEISVQRKNGPKDLNTRIILETPILPTLELMAALGLFVFIVGIELSLWIAQKMKRIIEDALLPVKELDLAIRNINTLKNPSELKITGISELDSIRSAIKETHEELTRTQSELTESRAKEMTTQAYKRLIHDLHNPVSSLRNLIKLTNSEKFDEQTRQEAISLMPSIAEQILLQITAAKFNLNFEVSEIKQADIRALIEEATLEAQYAFERFDQITVQKSLPCSPVMISHDPKLMRRAIGNLVNNALHACKNQVHVSLQHSYPQVIISVMDDGPGLSLEDAGLYLQGRKKSTKGDRQALGLASTSHIIRSHGGKIIYRKSPLGGACFEIQI